MILKDILEGSDVYVSEESYTLLKETKQNSDSGLIFAGYLNKTIRKGVKES